MKSFLFTLRNLPTNCLSVLDHCQAVGLALKGLKYFYYIFKNQILLKIIRILEAAIEKCSKKQVFVKNQFFMFYIYMQIYFKNCTASKFQIPEKYPQRSSWFSKRSSKLEELIIVILRKIELPHRFNLRIHSRDEKQ